MTSVIEPVEFPAHRSAKPSGKAFLGRLVVAIALALSTVLIGSTAHADAGEVQTAWRLLDYIAVDYGGAVAAGRVKSVTEYAEMTEFAASVTARINALPPNAARGKLAMGASKLSALIAAKAPPNQIAVLAHGLAAELLSAYPVPLAPHASPDLRRGAELFAQNCANCHGAQGDGRGPDAAKLTTPPIAFSNVERARQRSSFALYQVISQGIDGTAMQSFARLASEDRWALSFYAGRFAFSDAEAKQGELYWKSDPALRRRISNLTILAGLTPAALGETIGAPKADAVFAYLRRNPDAVQQGTTGSLAVTRGKLNESLTAYRKGDRQGARALALAAYLDGFEPVEPVLTARDATLMGHIETSMGELRAALQREVPADDIATRIEVIDGLLADAETALSPDSASSATTFLGALTILLREGLEALLIVVAMIAFLRKAERRDILPYVHGGWLGALVAGAVTWAIATYAMGISGASRELTEGFGSLFAAVVLLSVGIWMHGKAQANEWQRYIHERMSAALSGRSAWLLFGLAFIVVYREVFETILFYAALWTQGNGGVMLAGAGTAILLLAGIAWIMLHYSRTLPISKFFSYSSWLMAVLTVILAGKGVSALQEAGIIDISPLSMGPRISVLGIFPTLQTLAAQLAMLAAIIYGFWRNGHKAKRRPAPAQDS